MNFFFAIHVKQDYWHPHIFMFNLKERCSIGLKPTSVIYLEQETKITWKERCDWLKRLINVRQNFDFYQFPSLTYLYIWVWGCLGVICWFLFVVVFIRVNVLIHLYNFYLFVWINIKYEIYTYECHNCCLSNQHNNTFPVHMLYIVYIPTSY